MYAARNWLMGGMAILALNAVPSGAGAKGLPDTIELGSMASLYEKVKFDHAGHIKLIKDCAECHHHTTGTLVHDPVCARCHKNSGATTVVACKGCHEAEPFSAAAIRGKSSTAYHTDRLGLKGAYHQNCTGCHEREGGPTGCRDCHARRKNGDVFYRADIHSPSR